MNSSNIHYGTKCFYLSLTACQHYKSFCQFAESIHLSIYGKCCKMFNSSLRTITARLNSAGPDQTAPLGAV